MFKPRLTKLLRIVVVAATLSIVAACQTAPVQEMSDARLAIAAAQDAGAETYASGELRLAVGFLQSAEEHLSRHAYDSARRDAVQAKEQAINALQRTETTRPENP